MFKVLGSVSPNINSTLLHITRPCKQLVLHFGTLLTNIKLMQYAQWENSLIPAKGHVTHQFLEIKNTWYYFRENQCILLTASALMHKENIQQCSSRKMLQKQQQFMIPLQVSVLRRRRRALRINHNRKNNSFILKTQEPYKDHLCPRLFTLPYRTTFQNWLSVGAFK